MRGPASPDERHIHTAGNPGRAELDELASRLKKAGAKLLEPIMKVEAVTPEDFMGDVMGDLSRRRGVLQGSDDSPSGKLINALVPLGEMFGYATSLRSLSQGRATFTMEFDHYADAPNNIAEQVIKKA